MFEVKLISVIWLAYSAYLNALSLLPTILFKGWQPLLHLYVSITGAT